MVEKVLVDASFFNLPLGLIDIFSVFGQENVTKKPSLVRREEPAFPDCRTLENNFH